MKSMSISVILDWIPDKYRIFYKSTVLDQLFRHARMLDDSMEIIDNDFLYLTQEISFLDREWDIRKPRFLIFCTKTGSKEGQINPSWMEHAAILYTDEPFHKVFREFLDIFDKYYAWYEQCLNIIIENKDVSDLLDYATTFLCNPIALFSPTGKLLHYTGKFQEKIEGTLWDEVINFGFTPTESIYPDEHQRVMQEIHSGNRLISSVFRQDPSHHSLTAPLYFEGKNFGAFGTTDINGPFTEAQKALLLEVVHFTELAMNHQIQPFLLQDEENYYVIRLLQGYPADELSTSYYLQARNYTNQDIWYLYQFSLPESDVSDTRQSAYIHQIKNILPHGVVLYFEHSIVAVCRRRDFDPDYEKSYAALEDLLKRLSLKVYISTRFFRFTELSMAYGQCRLMKSYPLEPQKHIQRFDEAFLHVLYGVLKEKNSLPGFCHPAVLSLWQSHMEQDLTLIHNLKCYLINGRNIAETARTLHLHRNTLIYRLRKIEDLLHISLDYLDENMLLYLLISCLICETL